jgi:hypothetical protein
MVMTKSQWDAIQAKLPREDRTSYDEYLASQGERLDAAAAANAANAAKTIAALQELGVGGAAPVDTRAALAKLTSGQTLTDDEKRALGMAVTTPAPTPTPTSDVPALNNRNQVPTEAPGEGYKWQWVSMAYANNKYGGEWRKVKTSSSTPTPTPTPPQTSGTDPETKKLIQSLQDQIANLTNQQNAAANIAAANAAKAAESQRQSIIATLTDRFAKYGLSSLVNKVRELAIDGATEATITLALQETPEYQQRFAANAERLKKNLQVLTPAEYINLEDSYRQVLRAYGLKQFDTDDYVRQFISNDMSAAELSDRVVTAVQRVQNADPAISRTLRDYYGIGTTDLVAYVLDPNQQLQKIQRQVAASEIGAAARVQGLEAGVSVAEQLAAQGVTQAQAQKGYATIADILPTAEKLSQIYGGTMDAYGQAEAEQEVFNQLASAQKKREKLTAREVAAFSGQSGLGRTALTSSTQGQF